METYAEGKRLYEQHCNNCHMEDGKGLGKLIPPIAQSDYLKNHASKIACIIKYGQKGTIIVNGQEYNQEMPGIPLEDVQIHNIINYIRTNFENNLSPQTIKETKSNLESCP